MLQSRSWKLTQPLRFIGSGFRKTRSKTARLFSLSRDWWVIRNSGLFDKEWYVANYPDVARFRWGPVVHYLFTGAAQGNDPHQHFNTSYYIKNNPDVAVAGVNPLSHFLRRGAAEGRDPNPSFDTDWYLNHYPAVAKTQINPLVHYLKEGRAKGVACNPPVTKASDDRQNFTEELNLLRQNLAIQVAGLTAHVTVVVPCFNYGEYVKEAVDSVLEQIYPRVNVVVVNDGSTDPNTLSILSLRSRYPRVTIHHQENQGLSAARITGRAFRILKYLLFLDADDRLTQEAIAILLLELDVHADRAFAYSYQRFFGDQEMVWACQSYNAYDLLWRNHPSVCSLIRADWFRRSPGYRPQMLYSQEDWEHWIELSTMGGFGFCVPVPLFEHRRHGVTMTHTAQIHLHYSAPILRNLNKSAYSPAAIAERKRMWRPTVSVVIPFYNRIEYVSETLASLAEQTISDFEVLVNDGSDSPVAALADLRNDGLVRVLDCAHRGVAAAQMPA